MRYAVVSAGGTGTRLWPLSRGTRPKQLLVLGGGKSLLRLAYERLVGLLPSEQIFVCAGAVHRDAIMEHLPELPAANFLGEPSGRDTANAIGFASAILHERDPDATVAFIPSDHVIDPVEEFQAALSTGFEIAEQRPDSLVVFGIPPTSAHTGLGYIDRGEPVQDDPEVFAVSAFTEKPDVATAEEYVGSGHHLWNAGTFVWRADTLLAELERHLPRSYDGLRRIGALWSRAEPEDRNTTASRLYADLPKISIDHAVLEPVSRQPPGASARLLVVHMGVNWLDVGSWPALARTFGTDTARNACDAITAFVDSEGNIVVSDEPGHLVATVGLHDTIVVHTKDITMVCPMAEAERVKDLAAWVRDTHGEHFA